MYWAEYGFCFVRLGGVQPDDGVFQRNFRWNERNQLIETSDSRYTALYRYGADKQRAIKFVANAGRTTLYFNSMEHDPIRYVDPDGRFNEDVWDSFGFLNRISSIAQNMKN